MNFFKRTMPLMITAGVGFVLIVASFIPATVGWGEVAAVWFDILAAVAFILGGGNLLKVQLKKISDRAAGWGYSLITLIAFLVTLAVGLFKVETPPADNQEFYGQVFAKLDLNNLPESQTFRVAGEIPHSEVHEPLPASVRRQLSEEDGQLVFQGWIRGNQIEDLKAYNSTLRWLCTLEQLQKTAQPPPDLKGKISYFSDHRVLAFSGAMTDFQKKALLDMKGGGEAWKAAVEDLYEHSRRTVQVKVVPPTDFEIPALFQKKPPKKNAAGGKPEDSGLTIAGYDSQAQTLSFTGPMSTDQRDLLLQQFPIVVPLSQAERADLRREIESRGQEFTKAQLEEFNKVLDGLWTAEQLTEAVNAGGVYKEEERTACELLEDQTKPLPARADKPDAKLTAEQAAILKGPFQAAPVGRFVKALTERLEKAGKLTDGQKKAVEKFLQTQPTLGERNRMLYFVLLKRGPVSAEQKMFLLEDIQAETVWQKRIVQLFLKAHQVKYRWSGNYNEQGTPFWWIYEYLFKPLTATMFALLAFYVASAAFRAFRAKNVEASLLLGTAFIILLGRTFAGVLLTSWMPAALSGLRIENLAVYIMQVFNTAGNRAIMIGIALGIASTSLKVLLGIDRSYLGSSED